MSDLYGYIFHLIRNYELVGDISILATNFEDATNILQDVIRSNTYCSLIDTDDPKAEKGTLVIFSEL